MSTHPSREKIVAMINNQLSEDQFDEIGAHIASCKQCEATIKEIESNSDDPFLQGIKETFSSSRPPEVPGFEILDSGTFGGMGVIFRGRSRDSGEIVAIKRPIKGSDPDRFNQETEALSILDHSNIVKWIDNGDLDDGPFLVMEYIDGGTLADQLQTKREKGQRYNGHNAAQLVRALADAIQHAHEKGIVHRDIKPANILMKEGSPRISDFGIAKFLDSSRDLTGDIRIGTPQYMAPEQINRKKWGDVGPPTDVYALGAVLYELLSNQPPFQSESETDLLNSVSSEEPIALKKVNTSVHIDLDTITMKCLQKASNKRYSSARKLAEDLDHFLEGQKIIARRTSKAVRAWSWCKKNPAVASLVMLVGIVTTLGTGFSLKYAFEASKQTQIAESKTKKAEALATENANLVRQEKRLRNETEQQLYSSQFFRAREALEAGHYGQAANVLATTSLNRRNWETGYLTNLAAGTPLTIDVGNPIGAESVCFSPNGQLIASTSGYDVQVWDATTGAIVWRERTDTRYSFLRIEQEGVRPVSLDARISFSRDGRKVIAGYSSYIDIWDSETGKKRSTLLVNNSRNQRADIIDICGMTIATTHGPLVTIWDANTGNDLLEFNSNDNHVNSIDLSINSTKIVTAGDSIQVWDTNTGGNILEFEEYGTIWKYAFFSPNGRNIAIGSNDGAVRVLDASTGEELHTFEANGDSISCMSFTPDGRGILVGHDNGIVRALNCSIGTKECLKLGHQDSITGVNYSPDGRRFVTSSADGTIKVWDHVGNPCKSTLECTTSNFGSQRVECVDLSPDGRHAVSGDREGIIKVFDALTREEIHSLNAHKDGVKCIGFSQDGRQIVSGSLDGTVKLWDVSTGDQLIELDEHSVDCVSFSPNGQRVATGVKDTVKIWNTATGKEILNLPLKVEGIQDVDQVVVSVSFSEDGSRITAVNEQGIFKVWNLATGEVLEAPLSIARTTLGTGRVFSNGQALAICHHNGDFKVWGPEGAGQIRFRGHSKPVTSIAFSADGQRIISASDDRTVKIWDTFTGEELLSLVSLRSTLYGRVIPTSVSVSRNGRRIIAGYVGGIVESWDAATPDDQYTLVGHTNKIASWDFSNDGQQLASVDYGGTINVWDIKRGIERLTILSPRGPDVSFFPRVFFSPDSQRLVSFSLYDIKVWNAKTGVQLYLLDGIDREILSVTLSHDGLKLVAQHWNQIYSVWNFDTGEKLSTTSSERVSFSDLFYGPQKSTRIRSWRAIELDRNLQLVRKNSQYDLWAEDVIRRKASAENFHLEQATASEVSNNWFAAEFHLRHLLSLENIANEEEIELRYQEAVKNLKASGSPK